MSKPRTWKQQERQSKRGRNESGQYSKLNPCYRCGKSAGADYASDRRTDDMAAGEPVGDDALCLCEKCYQYLDGLSDEQFLAEIGSPDYGQKPQGRA